MIYYTETNLNTEAKQAKIVQAKQFLVPPLLIASFWSSRVVIAQARIPRRSGPGIYSSVQYSSIKWSVYCQYGQYSLTFRALALRQRETGENRFSLTKGQCSKRQTYYPYWQYTDHFIFRFVSLLCLRSTLRLLQYSSSDTT